MPEPVTANTSGAKANPTSAKPDVEMAESTSASPPVNPTQPAPSASGPPTSVPTSKHDAIPMQSTPASVPSTSVNGAPAPPLPTPQDVSHVPQGANRGTSEQCLAAGTRPSHAAATTPDDAAVKHQHRHRHQPHATQGYRQSAAPTPNPQTQLQPVPSLSQQVSANPAHHLSNTRPAVPPASVAQAKPPIPSPRNLTPHALHSSTPNAHVNNTVTPSFKRSFGGDVRQPAASAAEYSRASSQQTPFREPHTPSAMDPYTVDNIFTGGGYHLSDPADDQVTPTAYVAQCNELYSIIRNMHPSVVRRVIRDTWQTSLAGSEAHISFVVGLAAVLIVPLFS